MKHRKVRIDFSNALPHWNPVEPEFSQRQNAASTVLPHLEPYLNKVMKLAKDQLADTDAVLKDEIALFIKQEANHYKQHQAFNRMLYDNGYEKLKVYEAGLQQDYDQFLKQRSLKFNLAYSEGFESSGIVVAEFFFKHASRWLDNADDSVKKLWLWHLAEEFEHRTVCYDVYQRLYGSYFYRIYGLLYAMVHLFSYGGRVGRYLITQDRESGCIVNDWRSRWRLLRFQVFQSAYLGFKMLRVLSPFYDPANYAMPKAAEQVLAEADLATSTEN